jgi:hypothetical protein
MYWWTKERNQKDKTAKESYTKTGNKIFLDKEPSLLPKI